MVEDKNVYRLYVYKRRWRASAKFMALLKKALRSVPRSNLGVIDNHRAIRGKFSDWPMRSNVHIGLNCSPLNREEKVTVQIQKGWTDFRLHNQNPDKFICLYLFPQEIHTYLRVAYI